MVGPAAAAAAAAGHAVGTCLVASLALQESTYSSSSSSGQQVHWMLDCLLGGNARHNHHTHSHTTRSYYPAASCLHDVLPVMIDTRDI